MAVETLKAVGGQGPLASMVPKGKVQLEASLLGGSSKATQTLLSGPSEEIQGRWHFYQGREASRVEQELAWSGKDPQNEATLADAMPAGAYVESRGQGHLEFVFRRRQSGMWQ